MIIEVNVRDHPRRKPSECWDWCLANCSGRWDFVQEAKGVKFSYTSPEWAGDICGWRSYVEGDEDFLRPADAERSQNWGLFFDFMLERGGSRNLAMLKQFVKVRMGFSLAADAKAFRRWLREDKAA